MRIRPFTRFVEHWFLSRHTHGYNVHSPYFYDIINIMGSNNFVRSHVYSEVENWRIELLKNRTLINTTDYGTGNGGIKRVSDAAVRSSVNKQYAALLAYFSSCTGERPVIELGTSFGISSMAMALANPDASVITIEGCSSRYEIALQGMKKYGIRNVKIINGSFDDEVLRVANEYKNQGVVFIDGNHRGSALIRYYSIFAETISREGVIIIDDIDYSRDMNRAWNIIVKKPEVAASIDTGKMGILFFKRGIFGVKRYRVWY